jgi:hypothetical protein
VTSFTVTPNRRRRESGRHAPRIDAQTTHPPTPRPTPHAIHRRSTGCGTTTTPPHDCADEGRNAPTRGPRTHGRPDPRPTRSTLRPKYDYNAMVIDLLGPSLEDLFNFCTTASSPSILATSFTVASSHRRRSPWTKHLHNWCWRVSVITPVPAAPTPTQLARASPSPAVLTRVAPSRALSSSLTSRCLHSQSGVRPPHVFTRPPTGANPHGPKKDKYESVRGYNVLTLIASLHSCPVTTPTQGPGPARP